MSRLTVTAAPWSAVPGTDTTIEQLQKALDQFPQLVLEVAPLSFEISFGLDYQAEEPPTAGELASVMFGDAEGYVIEDSGLHQALDLAEAEARDRHFEDDQDLV